MAEVIKVAVIGTGMMGKNHCRTYADLDNVHLVAVCDINKDAAKSMAKKYNCLYYTDYKLMINVEKPDIVSIVVPTTQHREVALYCLENKCNVLLEKPIADNIVDAKAIIKSAKKNRVKLMIGFLERFNSAVIELKKRLDDNKLGKIFKIDINRIGPFPDRIRDVGVIIDLTSHDLDLARYLLNSEVDSVYSITAKNIHTRHEDMFNGILKFNNKVIVTLNTNWLTPTKVRNIYVTGEKGMFYVDLLKQELIFYENQASKDIKWELLFGISEGNIINYKFNKTEPLKSEIKHFIDCVDKTDIKPLISGDDGLKALEVALKLLK